MSQALSIAYIRVDGEMLRTQPGAKINLGGKKRTPVVGVASVDFSEELEAATVECELILTAGYSLEKLRAIKGATVTFEGDTGQTYVVRDAFVTDTLEVNAGEGGKVALKFAGQPAEELVS